MFLMSGSWVFILEKVRVEEGQSQPSLSIPKKYNPSGLYLKKNQLPNSLNKPKKMNAE